MTANSNETKDMQEIAITHIAGGAYCGIEDRKYVAVTSDSTWKELWDMIHRDTRPVPEVPAIDFSRETVIGVFLGTRSTGGYSIEIVDASLQNNKLSVKYKTESPAPGDMVSMALTQPYHVVTVNVTRAEVEFSRQ